MRVRRSSPIQILHLTDSVRRVGVAHACFRDTKKCCLQNEEGILDCQALVPDGKFILLA